MGDLVPFIQLKKREKYSWRTATFGEGKACSFTKSDAPLLVLFTFFIESHKALQMLVSAVRIHDNEIVKDVLLTHE